MTGWVKDIHARQHRFRYKSRHEWGPAPDAKDAESSTCAELSSSSLTARVNKEMDKEERFCSTPV